MNKLLFSKITVHFVIVSNIADGGRHCCKSVNINKKNYGTPLKFYNLKA